MTSSTQRDLVPVHGGLEQPVDRIVSYKQKAAFLAEAESLPVDPGERGRPVDGPPLRRRRALAADRSDGAGRLRPRARRDGRSLSNGKKYAWTIPLSLPVTGRRGGDAEEGRLLRGSRPRTATSSRSLDIETFEWDKKPYLEASTAPTAPTIRAPHGRQRRATKLDRRRAPCAAAATAEGLRRVRALAAHDAGLHPRQEVGACARLPDPQPAPPRPRVRPGLRPRDADGAGLNAGAVLNPLIGETKGDDVNAGPACTPTEAPQRARCSARATATSRSGRRRGWDISDVFELLGLDIKMFYGGPKEAVMHGIYRQNFGFTDIVIGRKHADAPYHDGKAIWGDFDAQEIFDNLAGELKIKPCKVGFAAYYESLGRVDLMDNHEDEKPVFDLRQGRCARSCQEGERPSIRASCGRRPRTF